MHPYLAVRPRAEGVGAPFFSLGRVGKLCSSHLKAHSALPAAQQHSPS